MRRPVLITRRWSLIPAGPACVPLRLVQPGKSLYTTIREFVENSLDAAEAINELPEIEVTVERLDAQSFNSLRGITAHQRKDSSLYHQDKPRKPTKKESGKPKPGSAAQPNPDDEDEDDAFALPPPTASSSSSSLPPPTAEEAKESGAESKRTFFRVTCIDNGGGMPHEAIPSMLGIVLSSTKYGVKQTRGKFGLGAKMALVWAKKSTGLPIEVRSSVGETEKVTECVLDIDIHRNEPRVLRHEKVANPTRWKGTEMRVVIEGNWTSYRGKVVQYFKLLAVITPYANLRFRYRDGQSDKKSFSAFFQRRTDVMPPQAKEVKHHPSSVDNLLVETLIHHSKDKMKLRTFLSSAFSNITPAHATRLISELSHNTTLSPDTPVATLTKRDIHQLTQLLKEAKFDKPSDDCLSPAGEYNLRLGIVKELQPEMVATFRDGAGVSEGHPFLVEAAVSIGGRCKPGINIFRYANRIPLLFEGSNDVVSVVCSKSVRWSSYRMKMQTDRIGVYVSIVSSKIPFKGTSKEYIGDDRDVLHASVKRSIVQCCVQLRKRIVSKQKQREKEERKRMLKRYIPDVSRAVWAVLEKMKQDGGVIAQYRDGKEEKRGRKRKREEDEKAEEEVLTVGADTSALYDRMMKRLRGGELSEGVLADCLHVCVDKKNSEMVMEYVVEQGRKSGEVEHCQLGVYAPQDQNRNALLVQHPMATIALL